MRIVIHAREDRGWPVLTVEPPVREAGDGLRIENYALDRYRDFLTMCRAQREATRRAREDGRHRRPLTFAQLLAETFGKADEGAAAAVPTCPGAAS